MEKKKDVVSVDEAIQQFTDVCNEVKLKQWIADHIGNMMLLAFVTGILSADSVKIRESLIDLAVSIIKRFLFVK